MVEASPLPDGSASDQEFPALINKEAVVSGLEGLLAAVVSCAGQDGFPVARDEPARRQIETGGATPAVFRHVGRIVGIDTGRLLDAAPRRSNERQHDCCCPNT